MKGIVILLGSAQQFQKTCDGQIKVAPSKNKN